MVRTDSHPRLSPSGAHHYLAHPSRGQVRPGLCHVIPACRKAQLFWPEHLSSSSIPAIPEYHIVDRTTAPGGRTLSAPFGRMQDHETKSQ